MYTHLNYASAGFYKSWWDIFIQKRIHVMQCKERIIKTVN